MLAWLLLRRKISRSSTLLKLMYENPSTSLLTLLFCFSSLLKYTSHLPEAYIPSKVWYPKERQFIQEGMFLRESISNRKAGNIGRCCTLCHASNQFMSRFLNQFVCLNNYNWEVRCLSQI